MRYFARVAVKFGTKKSFCADLTGFANCLVGWDSYPRNSMRGRNAHPPVSKNDSESRGTYHLFFQLALDRLDNLSLTCRFGFIHELLQQHGAIDGFVERGFEPLSFEGQPESALVKFGKLGIKEDFVLVVFREFLYDGNCSLNRVVTFSFRIKRLPPDKTQKENNGKNDAFGYSHVEQLL